MGMTYTPQTMMFSLSSLMLLNKIQYTNGWRDLYAVICTCLQL